MLQRYLITLGSATTSGGKVTSANSLRSIDAVKVALVGDKVWCPACGSEGIIRPDGPRLAELFDGRQVALNGDLCVCGCSPPPRLVAAQGLVCQCLNLEYYDAQAAEPAQ
jgi:type VI secretion system secreted protein VgrG